MPVANNTPGRRGSRHFPRSYYGLAFFIKTSQQPCQIDILIPTSQIKLLRLRDVKKAHTQNKLHKAKCKKMQCRLNCMSIFSTECQNPHSRLWLKQVPGTLGTKAEQSTWFQIRDEAEEEQLLNSGAAV